MSQASKPEVDKPSLTLERHLKAPVERVFEAWTDGQALKLWFGNGRAKVITADVDLRVGGRYRIVLKPPEGDAFRVGGIYRQIVPNRRLVFTWAWESTPERESLVTVDLAPAAGGTNLRLTHEQLFDQDARDRHAEGWTRSLERLEAALATTNTTALKLYGFPPSPNTWKVMALAGHLGLALEREMVDLTKGGHHDPAYLKLNPTGRTPTLVDGDLVLWESTAILQYMASCVPTTLWPQHDRVRADIMRWQSWQMQHWGPQACEPLLFERIVKPFFNIGAPDPVVVAKAEVASTRKRRSWTPIWRAAARWSVMK